MWSPIVPHSSPPSTMPYSSLSLLPFPCLYRLPFAELECCFIHEHLGAKGMCNSFSQLKTLKPHQTTQEKQQQHKISFGVPIPPQAENVVVVVVEIYTASPLKIKLTQSWGILFHFPCLSSSLSLFFTPFKFDLLEAHFSIKYTLKRCYYCSTKSARFSS